MMIKKSKGFGFPRYSLNFLFWLFYKMTKISDIYRKVFQSVKYLYYTMVLEIIYVKLAFFISKVTIKNKRKCKLVYDVPIIEISSYKTL